MNWRETLEDYQQRRIEQVENYARKFGYHDQHGDPELIATLIGRLDNAERMNQKLYEARPFWVKWVDAGVKRNAAKFEGYHPYTCYLFRRLDWLILWLTGQQPRWSKGRLCVKHWEANTHFPGWAYRWACDMQNKHYWTRLILDL
jgi:hypothetical protein